MSYKFGKERAIFYISKKHKRKCSHSNSKTKKDAIKNIIYEDYLLIKNFLNEKKVKPLKDHSGAKVKHLYITNY